MIVICIDVSHLSLIYFSDTRGAQIEPYNHVMKVY